MQPVRHYRPHPRAWLYLAALLPLAACVSRETTVVTQQRDTDQRLFQLETLRLQRDMLETERLKLWTTTPPPAPIYLGRGARRR